MYKILNTTYNNCCTNVTYGCDLEGHIRFNHLHFVVLMRQMKDTPHFTEFNFKPS